MRLALSARIGAVDLVVSDVVMPERAAQPC
jgi:hypothetical protein